MHGDGGLDGRRDRSGPPGRRGCGRAAPGHALGPPADELRSPTWLVAFPSVLPHHAWYGRKGVVLAETARDPRGDWLLSRPSRAGAASPRPFAGKPAESKPAHRPRGFRLVDRTTPRPRLKRPRGSIIERAGPRRVGPFAFDDAVAQATRIVRSSSGDWPGWPRTAPPAARGLCIGHVSRSWSVIALSGRSRSM